MLSKVYKSRFEIFEKQMLLNEETESSTDHPQESRFMSFFDELKTTSTEENNSKDDISTSGSSSPQLKVKVVKKLTIDIYKVLSREDRRTTVMIKNIPNKFSKTYLLELINQNFKGLYDLFILPTDSQDNKNFGFAFLNFTHSLHIANFYHLFNEYKWSCTNSKKICQITYSKIQGKSKLKKHYPDKILFINETIDGVKKVPSYCFVIPNIYKNFFIMCHPNTKVFPQESFSFCYI